MENKREKILDRRQRKSREAIFKAFIALLSHKDFAQISVGEIIDLADVGRATFYAHFASKDFLLKELCEELFCHIFDCAQAGEPTHRHLFECTAPDSVYLHLFQHFQHNDNNILKLLTSQNNELFYRYFKESFAILVRSQFSLFAHKKSAQLPESFWIQHVTANFIESLRWWVDTGMQESAEKICEYFMLAV